MPTVLYDDDCQFCVWCAARALDVDRTGSLRAAAIQSPEGRRLLGDLPEQERLESFHLIDDEGRRTSGGDALAPLLGASGYRVAARLAGLLPRPVMGGGYRLVAGNRVRISRLVPAGAKRRAREAVERRPQSSGPGGTSASA